MTLATRVFTPDAPKRTRAVERAEIWRVPDWDGLELMRANFIEHAFAPHMHEEFFIGVIESGVKSFRHRGTARQVAAGGLSLVNPGEVHTGRRCAGDQLSYRAFYLSEASLQVIFEHSLMPYFKTAVVNDQHLADQFLQAHKTLEREHDVLEGQSLLLQALGVLFERYSHERPKTVTHNGHRAVSRARDFLEARAHTSISLFELAAAVDLSAFHLNRVFRHETGLTPHEYQTQLRIERSKRLLKKRSPIVQVALEVGYADQANFSKQFKRLTGVTPGRYVLTRSNSKRI